MNTTSSPLPLAAELQTWAPLVRGRKFLWLLAPPWDHVWTRQNHFATRLARLGAEVLYVENPSSWTSTLKQKNWRRLPAGATASVREIEPGLHVMKPAFTLPGGMRSDFIARTNAAFIAGQVAAWTGERGWTDCVGWCRLPHSGFALERLRPATTVYDITDDYELFELDPRTRARVRERETKLIRRADCVFVTTPELQRKENLDGVITHRIPNGVDVDLFAQAGQPGEIPPLVSMMRRPIIGCVGLVSPWTDFDLLEKLGRRWPNQVLMVGPVAAQVEERAKALPGVVWGGFVPQRELPPYLRGMDVCIMPYVVNDRTVKASPLRMWEYIATGKPVVSVDLPAVRAASEYVDVARDREHFVALLEQRLTSGAAYPASAAQSAARAYSWDTIFHEMMQHLEPHLRASQRRGGVTPLNTPTLHHSPSSPAAAGQETRAPHAKPSPELRANTPSLHHSLSPTPPPLKSP